MISNFRSQSPTDTKPGAPVTETNILTYMGGYEVVPHTPHEHHPSDRIFGQRPKCDFSSFPLVFLDWLVPYMIKPSSVTKRNIMDWIGKGLGIVYTPHQCRYSDRKAPCWDESPKVPYGAFGTSIIILNTLPRL